MPLQLKSLLFIEVLLTLGVLLFRAALRTENRAIIGPKAIALTLLTPAVALMCGNAYIFYLYLVASLALTSRTRAELCATYLMMLPMTPALGQETGTGSIYLLPISAILAMNFGALIGFAFTSPKRIPGRRNLDIAAIVLVALFIFIDSRNVSVISVLRTSIVFFVQLGVPYLAFSRGVTTREDVNRILVRFAYAGTLCAVIAVFGATRHWVLYQSFNDALHITETLGSATLNIRGGRLRTGGTMVDYTAAGIFFASVLVVIPGLWAQFRRRWSTIVCIVLLGGLLATQSRGAWVATGIGLATVLTYRGYLARGLVLLAAAAAVQVALATIFAPTSKWAETFGTGGVGAQTEEYRRQLLSSGLRQIASHPLFGQPPRQLAANMSELTQGQHIVDFVNTHLYVALTAGVPWFGLWLMIWITPIVMAWRNRSVGKQRKTVDVAEMPMAIILTTMVALTFTSTIDRNLYWPAIALGLIGPCVALRRGNKYLPAQPRPVRLLEVSGQAGYGEPPLSAIS